MQKTIKKRKILYNISLEALWAALSDGKHLEVWFMENNFQGKEGAAFEFFDNPGEKWKGVYYGEVISYQPRINLAYSWSHKKLKHTTYVWWKIEQNNDDLIIELEHSGFKGFSDYLSSYLYSNFWNKKLRNLQKFLVEENSQVNI
jgi:uncharacterized protein YndB with AHSA1/START domain